MSIGQGLTLITGETGSGKTAQLVSWLMDLKDRPIFTMGIPELKIEHYPVPPVAEWTELRASEEDPSILLPYFTFPPNSVVVVDEAQRVWRPRPAGSKPPLEIQAFETRRHVGVDFVILTQHPNLLDSNIRRLVNRHIHIHCTFLGRYRLEWKGAARDPESKTDRGEAARVRYSPPKRAFPMYKSAEVHTKPKINRPWYYYALPVLMLAIAFGAWQISKRVSGEPEKVAAKPGQGAPANIAPGPAKRPETAAEYLASHQPRVAGLAHTAPVYDALTEPKEVPIIAGCIDSKSTGCKCYDQRGNLYRTTKDICRQVLDGGIFFAFVQEPQRAVATAVSPSSNQTAPGVVAVASGFTGDTHVRSGPLSPPPPKSAGS